jgi:hypothetical protein
MNPCDQQNLHRKLRPATEEIFRLSLPSARTPGTGDAFDRPNFGFTDPFPPRAVEISTDEELIARLNIRREEQIFELIYQRHLDEPDVPRGGGWKRRPG